MAEARPINEDAEDTLFRIFESASGLQRRTFRLLSRRKLNDYALNELRAQVAGILEDINALAENVAQS